MRFFDVVRICLGETGNIASGKSTLLQYFESRGAQVIMEPVGKWQNLTSQSSGNILMRSVDQSIFVVFGSYMWRMDTPHIDSPPGYRVDEYSYMRNQFGCGCTPFCMLLLSILILQRCVCHSYACVPIYCFRADKYGISIRFYCPVL